MRATEIIRDLLDLIDHIDSNQEINSDQEMSIETGVDSNRFRQIFDLISSDTDQMYDNSPAVVVADIDSVTTHAGGGWNGPKNPADLRGNSFSLYPGFQVKE